MLLFFFSYIIKPLIMSIIPATPLPLSEIRQTSLNLYDQSTKTELFQVKAYVDKAELSTGHVLNLAGSSINIINSDDTQVTDVVSTIKTLESGLAAEEAARSQRDTELTQLVDDEKVSRISAVGTLDNRVDQEIADRAAAIISAENKILDNKSRIDSILLGSDVDLDQFQEVVSYFNTLDVTRLQTISTLEANVAELGSALSLLQQQFASVFQ
jgi:hypothetical protein